jgi:hypothetical protein
VLRNLRSADADAPLPAAVEAMPFAFDWGSLPERIRVIPHSTPVRIRLPLSLNKDPALVKATLNYVVSFAGASLWVVLGVAFLFLAFEQMEVAIATRKHTARIIIACIFLVEHHEPERILMI